MCINIYLYNIHVYVKFIYAIDIAQTLLAVVTFDLFIKVRLFP